MFCTSLSQEQIATLDHLRYRDMYPIAREYYGNSFVPRDEGSYHPGEESEGRYTLEVAFYLILLIAFVVGLLVVVYRSDGKGDDDERKRALMGKGGCGCVKFEGMQGSFFGGFSSCGSEPKSRKSLDQDTKEARSAKTGVGAGRYADAATQTTELFEINKSTQADLIRDCGEISKEARVAEPVDDPSISEQLGEALDSRLTTGAPFSEGWTTASDLNETTNFESSNQNQPEEDTKARETGRSDSITPFPALDLEEYNTGGDHINRLSRKPIDLSISIPEPVSLAQQASKSQDTPWSSQNRSRVGTLGITPRSSYFGSPIGRPSGYPQNAADFPIMNTVAEVFRSSSSLHSPRWNAGIPHSRSVSEQISPKTVRTLRNSSVPRGLSESHLSSPTTSSDGVRPSRDAGPRQEALAGILGTPPKGPTRLSISEDSTILQELSKMNPLSLPTSPSPIRKSRKSSLRQGNSASNPSSRSASRSSISSAGKSNRRPSSASHGSWLLGQLQRSGGDPPPTPNEARARTASDRWERNERRPSILNRLSRTRSAFPKSVPGTPMSASIPHIPMNTPIAPTNSPGSRRRPSPSNQAWPSSRSYRGPGYVPPIWESERNPPRSLPASQDSAPNRRRATVSTWFKSGGLFRSGPGRPSPNVLSRFGGME